MKSTNVFTGQITLVCIAPLTNIAVALRIDPAFGKKLRQCIVMGGNTMGITICSSVFGLLPHAVNCGRFCFWRRQSVVFLFV